MDSFGESQSWHRGLSEAEKELFCVNPREAKEDEEVSGSEPGSESTRSI